MVTKKFSKTLRNKCDTKMTYPNMKILTESRTKSEKNTGPIIFCSYFRQLRKVRYLGEVESKKMEGVVCWEWKWNADGMKTGINEKSFNLTTLKRMCSRL